MLRNDYCRAVDAGTAARIIREGEFRPISPYCSRIYIEYACAHLYARAALYKGFFAVNIEYAILRLIYGTTLIAVEAAVCNIYRCAAPCLVFRAAAVAAQGKRVGAYLYPLHVEGIKGIGGGFRSGDGSKRTEEYYAVGIRFDSYFFYFKICALRMNDAVCVAAFAVFIYQFALFF